MDRGVISLFGVQSGMFVAMNSRGRLYGTVRTHARHARTAECGDLGRLCVVGVAHLQSSAGIKYGNSAVNAAMQQQSPESSAL